MAIERITKIKNHRIFRGFVWLQKLLYLNDLLCQIQKDDDRHFDQIKALVTK